MIRGSVISAASFPTGPEATHPKVRRCRADADLGSDISRIFIWERRERVRVRGRGREKRRGKGKGEGREKRRVRGKGRSREKGRGREKI